MGCTCGKGGDPQVKVVPRYDEPVGGTGEWPERAPHGQTVFLKKNNETAKNLEQFIPKPSSFIHVKSEKITDTYNFGQQLGEGGYGVVSIAENKVTGVNRAIKSIPKDPKKAQQIERFTEEVELMKEMDHPNIIQIIDVYEDDTDLYIVTELWTGGELFDYITSNRILSEQMAATVMQQLLSALVHCHEKSIVHRDLKPENLLLLEAPLENEMPVIKVIDFGFSTIIPADEKLNKVWGSPYYLAPEVLDQAYDVKCDIWSAGVILFILLCGYPPFSGSNTREIIQEIKHGNYEFSGETWSYVSKQAKNLITWMLERDVNKRVSAEQALRHDWIRTNADKKTVNSKLSSTILDNLNNFHTTQKLAQSAVTFITSQLITHEDQKELYDVFQQFDINKDGRLSREEIYLGSKKIMGRRQAIEEVERIMKQCDQDGSGYIDYSEFISASINKKKLLSKQNLQTAFEAFDADQNGFITADELRTIMQSVKVVDDLWDQILHEVDSNGDGKIDMKEFIELMLRTF